MTDHLEEAYRECERWQLTGDAAHGRIAIAQAIEQFEHAANEAAVSSWYAHMAQGFAAYMEHLRATATPHVSVPALPIDHEDERVVDELFAKRERTVRRMREEPPPGETVPEPFKLGRALYGSIPWNACEVPAGKWEDAETWERQAWDDVARNLYEAGRQSADDEIAAKDRRIEELELRIDEFELVRARAYHHGYRDGHADAPPDPTYDEPPESLRPGAGEEKG